MRKTLCLLFALCFLFCSVAAAEQPNRITFRDIPWFTNESSVYDTVIHVDNVSKPYESEKYRISSWEKYHWSMYPSTNLNNGGAAIQSSSAQLAGYEARLELEFIYPIIDGVILRKKGETQFFKAEYSINQESTDLSVKDIYIDLKAKLITLYGTPKESSTDDSYTSRTYWKGQDGSILALVLYYNTLDSEYYGVDLTYAAPNTETLLKELEIAIEKERLIEDATNTIPIPETDGNYEGL